jgi:hypothetical protein
MKLQRIYGGIDGLAGMDELNAGELECGVVQGIVRGSIDKAGEMV